MKCKHGFQRGSAGAWCNCNGREGGSVGTRESGGGMNIITLLIIIGIVIVFVRSI